MQSSSVAHAFANDSDEENERDKVRMTASEMFDKKYSTNKAKKLVKESLETDPSIYEYDEVYDSFKRTRGTTKEQQKADKEQKPKYIDAMLKNHKKRELQKLLHDDHTYKKEREKEANQFDDSEAFITESYRQKIAEREAFRREVERDDRMDEVLDVKGQQMWQQAFHRKMLEDITEDASTADYDVKVKSETAEEAEDVKPVVKCGDVADNDGERKFTSPLPPSSSGRRREENLRDRRHRGDARDDRRRTERHDRQWNDRRNSDSAGRRRGEADYDRHSSPLPPSSRSGGNRQPRTATDEEQAADAQRMARIREIVKQRNGAEEIEAARQRFFERQPIVPPV